MKTLNRVVVLAVCLFFAAGPTPLFAQDLTPAQKYDIDRSKAAAPNGSVILSGAGFGTGLGVALVLVGAGYGFSKIGSSALESMARQPEVAGQIQTAMIIIGALLEGATFFALIVCILLLGRSTF